MRPKSPNDVYRFPGQQVEYFSGQPIDSTEALTAYAQNIAEAATAGSLELENDAMRASLLSGHVDGARRFASSSEQVGKFKEVRDFALGVGDHIEASRRVVAG